MEDVEIVVAHQARVTLRVGDVFLKVDPMQENIDAIRGWWSFKCLTAVRWLDEHGYGPVEDLPEVAVLRSQMLREGRRSSG